MCLHALRGRYRYWTAQPAMSYRFVGHGHHGRQSQWSPTVTVPPITPGTPRRRCDRTEPPPRAVRPSQHALALLRLPACDGRRCLAHAAVVQMLGAALTLPSVDTSVNQRSTDLSVRFGLVGLSASVLQCIPAPVPPRPKQLLTGRKGIHPGSCSDSNFTGSAFLMLGLALICRHVQRQLRRNESAHFYHHRTRQCLPPRKLRRDIP